MGETKYIASSGIAFSEETDLKTLRKYAAKGWNVKRFKRMGYELEKSTPEDVIFSIDIRLLEDGELEEYMEMFEMAGWTHVCSDHSTHLFKAKPGTKPIYTDIDSKKEKVNRLRKSVIPAATISFIAVIVSYILYVVSSGVLNKVFSVVFMMSIVLAIPMGMTLIATYYHSYRTK